jgi:hypothetical protein
MGKRSMEDLDFLKKHFGIRSPLQTLRSYYLYLLMKKIDNGNLKCKKCNQPIDNFEEWSLGHTEPWRKLIDKDGNVKREGDAKLFWDVNNLQAEHSFCNLPDSIINKNGYKGVHENGFLKNGLMQYVANISIENKKINLGYTQNLKLAAEYYDIGIMKYRQGKGILNFPEKREEYKNRFDEVK